MSNWHLHISYIASLFNITETSRYSIKALCDKITLYGSTIIFEIFEMQKLKSNPFFLKYSRHNFSINKEKNPEPVPPPSELKNKNPWKEEHFFY